jgi:hypothetical protein
MAVILLLASAGIGPGLASGPIVITLQTSNFNGYQISCFGKKNGTIAATVSGGVTPYTYSWTTGATTANISQLASGYYKLTVMDADSTVVEADVTLNEPAALIVIADPYIYPDSFNISCTDCYNGSIDVSVAQGVPPYSYLWNDSTTTTQDRSGLGAKKYFVVVRDANNCWVKSETVMLTQPERTVWSMGGNTGTDPAQQYIGTADNKDVVMKGNGQERLRLKANGDIGLFGNDTTVGILYRDQYGNLKRGGGAGFLTAISDTQDPCTDSYFSPIWLTTGNDFSQVCPDQPAKLGTLSNKPVTFITNGIERMRMSTNGKIGIGTSPPNSAVGDYLLFVEKGIVCRDVLVKLGDWPDFVFQPNYALMPMDELRDFLKKNSHLPNMPSAAEMEAKGGLEVGETQRRMMKTIEEQALYILQLEEKYTALEQRMEVLEASKK